MFFSASGVEVNPILLLAMGLAVGVCSGFFGFGGGFMMTPALTVDGEVKAVGKIPSVEEMKVMFA